MYNGMFNKKIVNINGEKKESLDILEKMYEVSEEKERKKIENALREKEEQQIGLVIELIMKSNLKIILDENKENGINDLYLKSAKVRSVTEILREEVMMLEDASEEMKKRIINKIDYINAISLILIEEKNHEKEIIDNIVELELVLDDELEGYLSYEKEEGKRKMMKALYRYYILRSNKTVKGLEEQYDVGAEQKTEIFKDTFIRFVEKEGEEIFYYLAGQEEVKSKLMRMFEEQFA